MLHEAYDINDDRNTPRVKTSVTVNPIRIRGLDPECGAG